MGPGADVEDLRVRRNCQDLLCDAHPSKIGVRARDDDRRGNGELAQRAKAFSSHEARGPEKRNIRAVVAHSLSGLTVLNDDEDLGVARQPQPGLIEADVGGPADASE